MKIGVWLGYDIKESAGGAFSYIDRLIQLIDEHQFLDGIEICFVNFMGGGVFQKEVCPLLRLPTFLVELLKAQPMLYRIATGLTKRYLRKNGIKKIMARHDIKLIYYLHQGECLDSNFPFIATNWDIGHRSTHAFPELMWDGKPFEVREQFYRNVLPKALMVFCESKTGIEEIAKYTNIGEHKLRILPMFGGCVTKQQISEENGEKILFKYGLKKEKFYFYPAQFWAHKNHRNLVQAFARVQKKYPELKLVLSGSDKGNRDYIEQIIKDLDLMSYVVFLGFVPLEELYCMYKYATALVMASHFGPTNMPPIEAMEIGCPVACSDLGGHHEILGDAAVYFDSYDYNTISDAMENVYMENNEYRKRILSRRSITIYSEEKALMTLDKLLIEASDVRSNWK